MRKQIVLLPVLLLLAVQLSLALPPGAKTKPYTVTFIGDDVTSDPLSMTGWTRGKNLNLGHSANDPKALTFVGNAWTCAVDGESKDWRGPHSGRLGIWLDSQGPDITYTFDGVWQLRGTNDGVYDQDNGIVHFFGSFDMYEYQELTRGKKGKPYHRWVYVCSLDLAFDMTLEEQS